MDIASDVKPSRGMKRKSPWPEQRERFRQLQANKLRWWEALLSNHAFSSVAAEYVQRCTKEPFSLGKTENTMAKLAVSLDPYTEIASALLSDLDEIEIGHRPVHTREIFDAIKKDTHRRPLFDALASTIREDAPELQDLASSVRREAIAYRVLHNELVTANLGLVHGPARRRGRLVSHEDLAAEAVFGLMKAVHRFDPERETRFSTYAVPWIDQRVRRLEIEVGPTIVVPVFVNEIINRIRRASAHLARVNRTSPTTEEICAALNSDGCKNQVSVVQIETAMQAMLTTASISLNAPIGTGHDGTLLDVVADDKVPLDEQVGLLESSVEMILAGMPKIRVDAFRWSVGLSDETLETIGLRHHVSRARIQQLAKEAVNHVRRALARQASLKRRPPLPLPLPLEIECNGSCAEAADAVVAQPKSVRTGARGLDNPAWWASLERGGRGPAGAFELEIRCDVCGEEVVESRKSARLRGWRKRWIRNGSVQQQQDVCPACAKKSRRRGAPKEDG